MSLTSLPRRFTTIDRQVHRRGTKAYSWLREHGWEASPPQRGDATVFADEVRMASVTARRLHMSALDLHPGVDTPRHRALFVMQAEGRTEIHLRNGNVLTVDPFRHAAVDLSDVIAVRCQRPVARIEILADVSLFAPGTFQSPPPPPPGREQPGGEDLHSNPPEESSAASAGWNVITSAVNAVLNSEMAADSAALVPLEASLLHALVALTVESRHHQPALRHADRLSQAEDLIRRNAHRPDFSVQQLADGLDISTRYLARVFRENGTSPGKAIRAARISRARLAAQGGGVNLPDIAHASGFSSVRAMKQAFRLDGLSLER